MPVKIVGIGGTNRTNSLSYRALEIALQHAQALGAEVQGLKLRELQLPIYDPVIPLSEYGENVHILLDAVRRADGIMLSTGSYHGILAGITKNAMDLLDFLDSDKRPYLSGRSVGLIATGAGEHGAVTTLDSMIHMVHAMRGIVVPVTVPIGKAWEQFEEDELHNAKKQTRLQIMAKETVQLAKKLQSASS